MNWTLKAYVSEPGTSCTAVQLPGLVKLMENVSVIQESITDLLVPIDPSLEFVFELDAKNKLLMGVRRDGFVIPYSALSGGEKKAGSQGASGRIA